MMSKSVLYALVVLSLASNTLQQLTIPLQDQLTIDIVPGSLNKPPTVLCSVKSHNMENVWSSQIVYYRDRDLQDKYGLMVEAIFGQEGNVSCKLIPQANDVELEERKKICLSQCKYEETSKPGNSDTTPSGSSTDSPEPGNTDTTNSKGSETTEPGSINTSEPLITDTSNPGNSDATLSGSSTNSQQPGNTDTTNLKGIETTEPGSINGSQPLISDTPNPGNSDATLSGSSTDLPQPGNTDKTNSVGSKTTEAGSINSSQSTISDTSKPGNSDATLSGGKGTTQTGGSSDSTYLGSINATHPGSNITTNTEGSTQSDVTNFTRPEFSLTTKPGGSNSTPSDSTNFTKPESITSSQPGSSLSIQPGGRDTTIPSLSNSTQSAGNSSTQPGTGSGGPCNKDYTYIKELKSCYLFSNYTAQWYDGECACASSGGTLAIINNATEQEFLAGYLNESYWIGLNDKEKEGTFAWRDGSPLTYTNFAKASNNTEERDCVEMSAEYNLTWISQRCDAQRRFLCEAADPSKLIAPGVCPGGWTLNRDIDRCFYKTASSQTWDDSSAVCQNLGGSLASLHSTDETLFIKGIGLNETAWTGLNDKSNTGNYKWTDNSSTTYTNWIEGKSPSIYQYITSWLTFDKYCVELNKDNNYMWNVNSCSTKQKALCAMPAEKLPRALCPSGFKSDGNGSCFYISKLKADFNSSISFCSLRAVGAKLAIPSTDSQGSFITALMKNNSITDCWLGTNVANAISLKATSFLNLSKAAFSLITAGKFYNTDCVKTQTDGIWYGKSCTTTYNYVCMTSQFKTSSSLIQQ